MSPLEHVNRRGDRYYVLEGKTKTGKPKYYCSKKPNGVQVERLPEGFEVYESPEDAIVTIRRIRPSRILPIEREMLEKWVKEYAEGVAAITAVQDDALIVYSSDITPEESSRAMRLLLGEDIGPRLADADWMMQRARYSPMFRFELIHEDDRLYNVERWCFHGAIDGWYMLCGGIPLDKAASEYLPNLGKESFFELM